MKRLVFVFFSMGVFVCAGPRALAIGGTVGLTSGGAAPPACGSGATLFFNTTSSPIRFDLSASNTGGCNVTLKWTDPEGFERVLTLKPGFSRALPAITIGAREFLTWTSITAEAGVGFQWQLERLPSPPSHEGQD
jgi:hypothetical protein